LAPRDFLECEEGEPVALPLATPYVLGRRDGACLFLEPSLRCGAYPGRPNACRLYPHFLLLVAADGTPRFADHARLEDALAALEDAGGEPSPACERPVPLLVRHTHCPGFGGPPLDLGAWTALVRETLDLQFPEAQEA
jgi:hypothetical protein